MRWRGQGDIRMWLTSMSSSERPAHSCSIPLISRGLTWISLCQSIMCVCIKFGHNDVPCAYHKLELPWSSKYSKSHIRDWRNVETVHNVKLAANIKCKLLYLGALLRCGVWVILYSACGSDKETKRDAALGPGERSVTGAAEKPLKHQKHLYPCPRRSRSVDLIHVVQY